MELDQPIKKGLHGHAMRCMPCWPLCNLSMRNAICQHVNDVMEELRRTGPFDEKHRALNVFQSLDRIIVFEDDWNVPERLTVRHP